MGRQIIHVDMDEFFAAVEKLDFPELRGKCLLIGGRPEARGVVSTASYEARVFGCHSAMAMATAMRLCPQAIVRPVHGRRYRQVSEQVFELLGRFSPTIEPLSIDEAFLDVSGCERLLGPAEQIARRIKRAIRQEIGLTAGVGVAPNKFLAKLASDLQKPDGLVVITEENVHEILDPLPVSKLWGAGPAMVKQLAKLGLRTIGDLRQAKADLLVGCLGDAGEHFLRLAHGRDDRPVTPDSQAKSIGQEQTFPADVAEPEALRRTLLGQVEQVARRLRKHVLRARTVTVKLRTGDFVTQTRSRTLSQPTCLTLELWRAADSLLAAWAASGARPLRLLGVTVSQLQGRPGAQLPLFDDPDKAKDLRLDRTLDKIAGRFGDDAVRRGAGRP